VILKIFYSNFQVEKRDHFQLLTLILTNSKTIKEDVYSLSMLLIGEHQQTSIFDELKQLLNSLNNEIPTKMKETDDKFQVHLMNSITPFPLIPAFIKVFAEFSLNYQNFVKLIRKIIPLDDYHSASRKELTQKAKSSIEQFDSILQSIFQFFLNSSSTSFWLNSIQLINQQFEKFSNDFKTFTISK
jgi:hypothetical protein